MSRELIDASLDIQLKKAGLVVTYLQARHGMSEKELCLRAKIAQSTLRSIKAGTWMGSLQPFIRIASIFDVAFECRLASPSEALDIPKSFDEEYVNPAAPEAP